MLVFIPLHFELSYFDPTNSVAICLQVFLIYSFFNHLLQSLPLLIASLVSSHSILCFLYLAYLLFITIDIYSHLFTISLHVSISFNLFVGFVYLLRFCSLTSSVYFWFSFLLIFELLVSDKSTISSLFLLIYIFTVSFPVLILSSLFCLYLPFSIPLSTFHQLVTLL